MKKADLQPSGETHLIIPTIRGMSTTNGMDGQLGTKSAPTEELTREMIPISKTKLKDLFSGLSQKMKACFHRTTAIINKEMMQDMRNVHNFDVAQDVEDQAYWEFQNYLKSKVEFVWTDHGFEKEAAVELYVLTEDQMYDLITTAIANWEAEKDL